MNFIEPKLLSALDAEKELARLTEQLNLEVAKTKTAEEQCVSITAEVELLNSKLASSQEGSACCLLEARLNYLLFNHLIMKTSTAFLIECVIAWFIH